MCGGSREVEERVNVSERVDIMGSSFGGGGGGSDDDDDDDEWVKEQR